jgi:hypothetical protein
MRAMKPDERRKEAAVTEPPTSLRAGASLDVLLRYLVQPALIASSMICGLGLSEQAAAGTESFRQTCTHISRSQSNGRIVIRAACDAGRTPDGRISFKENPTELVIPPTGCADISNQRGELRCIGAEHPGGSWSRSCVEGRYIRGRVFQAVCAPAGTTTPGVYSSIDMNRCPSFRLENINGRLRCI